MEKLTMPAAMTPRERVLTTLNHQEPDRVPIDFGSVCTSIQVDGYRDLKRHLGLEIGSEVIINHMMRTARVEEPVLQRFQVDTRHVRQKAAKPVQKLENGDTVDEYGIHFRASPNGFYHEMVGHPLHDATLEDLERFELPDPRDPARAEGLTELAKDLYENSSYCVFLDGFSECVFGMASWLRGTEQFYTDLLLNRPFVELLIAKLVEHWKGLADNLLGKFGQYIHVLKVADDLGSQRGPLLAPALYRELIKPAQKEVYAYIRNLTDAKIMLHSCGSVYDLVDDFADIGVDCLNPIQVSAANMESDRLKREYGQRMAFWGGGCDTQRVLHCGTPDEVEQEVQRRICDLAPGGGFVFTAIHNIQPQTPPENICRMFDAVQTYGRYPIG